MRLLLAVLPCVAFVSAAFLGCSGGLATTSADGTTTGAGGDGGAADASFDSLTIPPVQPDAGDAAPVDAIWPTDATKLVAESPGGGFVPNPPAGSECMYGAQRYTLDLATKAFTFERCTAGATATDPLTLAKGGHTLTTAELGTVDAAMKKLVPPKDGSACGADKGEYDVIVTTPRGAKTFYDSFYACTGGGKLYVDNIDGVFEAFRLLAP